MLNRLTPVLAIVVLIAGMMSGIAGVVHTLRQHDIKRLPAYHSVENIGIFLIGALTISGRSPFNSLVSKFLICKRYSFE